MIKRINITLNTDNLTDLMLIKAIGIPLESLGSKEIKRYLLNTIVDDDFLFNQKRNVLSALQSNLYSNSQIDIHSNSQSVVKSSMNSEQKSVPKKDTDKQAQIDTDDDFDFDNFITEEEVKEEKELDNKDMMDSLFKSMNRLM